ncbi:MAG TPA: GNAT family N-acetyltransferase [Ktedonobacterales bacterium]|nr:GNAT family N-acetyltransferase [Ktedonobacterales bacterium]
MYRLAQRDAHLAGSVFAALEHHLAVLSALAGETPAEIYVDDPAHPQAGLLLPANRHRIYVAGVATPDFVTAVAAVLRQRYLPAGQAAQPSDAIVYYAPDRWGPALAEQLAGVQTWEAERRYYRLRLGPDAPSFPVPAGFTLRQIEAAVLDDHALLNCDELVAEVLSESPSVEEFLQHKLGYCAQQGQELAGWCLSEYNHAGRCEIGIETVAPYRRQGIGLATAAATLALAARQGIREVGWHCWGDNAASIGLATRLGFEEVARYRVLFCHFDAASANA